jgi:predicted MPP superfamily phosphohydrolase
VFFCKITLVIVFFFHVLPFALLFQVNLLSTKINPKANRTMAITPVFLVFTLLIILSQFLAWRYFLARLTKKASRFCLNFLYILANLLGLYALLSVYILDFKPPSSVLWDFIVRPGLIWEFSHIVWLIPALLITVLSFIWNQLKKEPQGLPKLFRAKKPGPSLFNPIGLILILFLALGFYGYSHQLSGPTITEITINFSSLPEKLDGLKIAAISDFHYGRGQNLDELNKTFAQVSTLNPDIVVLLGNLVHKQSFLTSDFKEPLAYLKNVPHGVFAVLGNYDLYTENPHNVTQFLTSAGTKVLSNESFSHPSIPLTLIGFSDPGTPVWELSPLSVPNQNITLPWNKLQGPIPPEGNFIILLNNRPVDIDATSARNDVDLFLAGHTRGGIYQLPWDRQINLASLFYDYSSGYYSLENMDVFVTRGLAAPLSPFRLFAWPEITLLTLKKALPDNQEETGTVPEDTNTQNSTENSPENSSSSLEASPESTITPQSEGLENTSNTPR